MKIKKGLSEQGEVPKGIKGIKKEIFILRQLGLEEYEINYIVYLREKEQASFKWNR